MTSFGHMRRYTTTLSFAALLLLAGCKATETPLIGKAIDSLAGQRAATEERLSTAAADAIAEGKTEEALAHYEKLYKHSNQDDAEISVNYAQLLRKTGKPQRALAVLAPFIDGRRHGRRPVEYPSPLLMTEYAASSIELGNFERAETLLGRVLKNESASGLHADVRNLMGIVLDTKGEYKEAEKSYRSALKTWKGDATSVMNNLGLNLANQGRFDESLTTLRQALVMAPHKEEIARNIEMVDRLRKSVVPSAPVDLKK